MKVLSGQTAYPSSKRDELFEKHKQKITQLVYTVKPYSTGMELVDFISEGFIEAIRAIEDYDSTKNVPIWNYIRMRIMYHFLHVLRKERSGIHDCVGLDDEMLGTFQAYKIPLYLELNSSLTRLTKEQEQVITLFFWYGYTETEIAEKLDIKRSRVNYIKRKALERLRMFLMKGD